MAFMMIIRCNEDRDCDRYIFAPEGMTPDQADDIIQNVVDDLNSRDELPVDWEELEAKLVISQGFTEVKAWAHSEVDF